MCKNQIKNIIDEYIYNLNSLNISKIISLAHIDIKVYSMNNYNIYKLASGIDQFKNILNSLNNNYQFIYWSVLKCNIKNEFSEVTVRQKIFFTVDFPKGPKAWEMNERILTLIFKFENSKIKKISILIPKN